MINYDRELNKIDDIVEKFDEIVARELSKVLYELEGTLDDIIDDYLDEVLDDMVEVVLSIDEEVIFDTYEVRQTVVDEIRKRLNLRLWVD